MVDAIDAHKAHKTCFVVMGFGKKTDFETGRTLDLDKSYKHMIKPAVEAAGLECVRADEIVHSGLIDVPMYEQLMRADVVVADLSTSNKNAYYELGIRHALRPFTTVVIAEDGIKTFPFDVNHVLVQQYHHLGDDIGYEEVVRFRDKLTKAIREILGKNAPEPDSPVYAFVKGLVPPKIGGRLRAAVTRGKKRILRRVAAESPEAQKTSVTSGPTHSDLMQLVDAAQRSGDFSTAKNRLTEILKLRSSTLTNPALSSKSEDSYILQRLALATLKAEQPTPASACKEARDLLARLEPHTSNDTETLGLWGSIHKRLWEVTQNPADLDEAVLAYRRGFYMRNDYYNGINLAFLLNVRSVNQIDPSEAIADYIQAERIRKQVRAICDEWLSASPSDAAQDNRNSRYWVLATMAEAYLGLGEAKKSEEFMARAITTNPEPWMVKSTQEQLDKLRLLLNPSPLVHLKNAADSKAGNMPSSVAS